MVNQVSKLAGGALALVLAGLMVVGCAADMGDVNLVQPNYVKKSDLLGKTWYYRRTVVDAPETQRPWLAIGTGDLFTIQRIRWEVQANKLIGYSDYEWVAGSEEGSEEGATLSEYGNPIVMFPITKHFDIARRYNSANGEPTNVIAENSNDRLWNEREYMRVDWGTNILGHNPFILDVSFIPVTNSRLITEGTSPSNPYRPRVHPETGYFDVVTAHTMIPDWYQCLYEYGFSWFTCGSGEARVRHSFMEMDQEEAAGYQPLNYPDSVPVVDSSGNEIVDAETGEVRRTKIWERFGYYRLERLTYDNYRSLTESGRMNRIIRFNIWEKSVDSQVAEIPYTLRTAKPITYYLNWDFPADLVDTAKEVAEEWNGVFKRLVAELQGKNIADVPDMFVLKQHSCSTDNLTAYFAEHGSVKKLVANEVGAAMTDANLANYCSAAEYFSRAAEIKDVFEWQQAGDARFNMLNWINKVSPAAFSGYGPMLADPVTGMNVVSTANLMGYTINHAAARARDYIDYENGDLELRDLMAGNHMPGLQNSPDYMPGQNMDSPMDMEEMNEMAQQMASPEHFASLEARFQGLGDSKEELLVGIENSEHFEERLGRVEGTSFEHEHLTRPEDIVLTSFGQWKPGDDITDEHLENASFIKNSRMQKHQQLGFAKRLQERTFCPMANLDDALVGLAKELKDKSPEERYQILRSRIFKAVALHEIGHNIGLRHNFEASYDALNYNRAFWDIETANITEEDKLEQHQPEYKYSSIMDYHGKINGDFRGLGLYDEAATKFGYGQLVEVFEDTTMDAGKSLRKWNFQNDYKKIPAHMGSVDTFYNRNNVSFDWTDSDERIVANVDDIEANEVPYLFCSDEYAGRTPTCNRFDFGANYRELQAARYVRYKNYFIFSNYLNGRIELPSWALMGRSYRYFREIITAYQYMYLYRSTQDEMFDGASFFETDLGQDMATAVGNGINMMAEVIAMPEPGRYYKCTNDDGNVFYYPSNMVSYSALEQPDPTNHVGYGLDRETCVFADTNRDGVTDDSVVPVLGQVQPLFLDLTDDFVTWGWKYIGTYWDKMYAIRELTDPWARFYRVNSAEDWRMYSVSPYRLYSKEILCIMSGLIQYDRKSLATVVDVTDDRINLQPKRVVDLTRSLETSAQAPAAGETAPVIIPALARNLQRTAMLYGMALLTSPLDSTLDFAKHTRVVLDGGYDDVGDFEASLCGGGTNSWTCGQIAGCEWDATALTCNDPVGTLTTASCTIPVSGKVFKAKQNQDGYNIAYDLVTECAAAAEYLETHEYEDVRVAYDAWQAARDDLSGAADPVAAQADIDAKRTIFRDKSRDWSKARITLIVNEQLLQYTRLVHLIYEHGAEL